MSDTPGSEQPLAGRAVRSVQWNLFSAVGKQGLRMLFMVLVARLIGPDDFGIASQAFIFIAFISVLRSEGFGAALVQKDDLGPNDRGSANVLNLMMAGTLIVLTLVLAPLYAAFFREPDLTPVLRVCTLSILFQSITMVPQALLMRRLDFRPIAVGEVGGTLLSVAVGLTAAALGASYWSLVIQQLVMDFTLMVVLLAATGVPSFRASRHAVGHVWGFGSRVLVQQVVTYTVSNADYVIVGRVLGAQALGYYSLAYRTMMLPVANLGLVVNRVAFSVYSKIQAEPARMGRQFLLASRVISLAAFPLMTLVAVAAPLGVPVVFGPEWQPAVLPMQILALSGALRSIQTMFGPVMLASGKPEWSARFAIVSGIAFVSAFLIGVQWDIEGVAIAYSLTLLALQPIGLRLVGRLTGITLPEFVRSVSPVIAASAALAAIYLTVELLLEGRIPDAATLVVAATASGLAYAVALRFGAPSVRTDVRRLVESRRQRVAEAVAAP